MTFTVDRPFFSLNRRLRVILTTNLFNHQKGGNAAYGKKKNRYNHEGDPCV